MTFDDAIATLKRGGLWLENRETFGLAPGLTLYEGRMIINSTLYHPNADELEALAVLARASASGEVPGL